MPTPVATPIKVVPLKNSTVAIVPSPSVAVATRFTAAGAVKAAPTKGAVMMTVGSALTMIVTGALTLTAPVLSVAFAVTE